MGMENEVNFAALSTNKVRLAWIKRVLLREYIQASGNAF
jgi:hypothetical protein